MITSKFAQLLYKAETCDIQKEELFAEVATEYFKIESPPCMQKIHGQDQKQAQYLNKESKASAKH